MGTDRGPVMVPATDPPEMASTVKTIDTHCYVSTRSGPSRTRRGTVDHEPGCERHFFDSESIDIRWRSNSRRHPVRDFGGRLVQTVRGSGLIGGCGLW